MKTEFLVVSKRESAIRPEDGGGSRRLAPMHPGFNSHYGLYCANGFQSMLALSQVFFGYVNVRIPLEISLRMIFGECYIIFKIREVIIRQVVKFNTIASKINENAVLNNVINYGEQLLRYLQSY